MGKVISKTGIKREKGFLYFVDKKGDVAKVAMARSGKKTDKKQQIVAKCGVKRQTGYLYYVDKNGDVCEAKMARGRK